MSSNYSLQGVSIFQDLDPDVRGGIEKACRWRNCEKHVQIIRHQDGSDDIVFIVRGRARVNIYSAGGRVVTFRDIGAGEFVGELSAIDGAPRSASIEALENCTVAYLSRDAFWQMLETTPRAVRGMLVHLSGQVRLLTERIYEFSTLAVRNRIQAELLRLSRGGADTQSTRMISPAPKHAELASRVATHREAVTRELRRLTELGVIEKSGRDLVICDVVRLSEMVDELSES